MDANLYLAGITVVTAFASNQVMGMQNIGIDYDLKNLKTVGAIGVCGAVGYYLAGPAGGAAGVLGYYLPAIIMGLAISK